MEAFIDDRAKNPRKRQMSKEKRLLANRHERERVRKMNNAYEELRSTIPNYEETRVKTKLELLRIATNYIQTLKNTIKASLIAATTPRWINWCTRWALEWNIMITEPLNWGIGFQSIRAHLCLQLPLFHRPNSNYVTSVLTNQAPADTSFLDRWWAPWQKVLKTQRMISTASRCQ